MRASSMNSLLPTSMDPTGAPSPFERQNITESKLFGEFHDGVPQGHAGVENSRAIEMYGQPGRVRMINDVIRIRQRIDRASRQV